MLEMNMFRRNKKIKNKIMIKTLSTQDFIIYVLLKRKKIGTTGIFFSSAVLNVIYKCRYTVHINIFY